jgi:hypothetical protein
LSAGEQLTDKLAEKAGVGRSTVYDAKKVLREGTPEEIKELESGKAKAKPLAEKIRRREKQSEDGEPVDDMGLSNSGKGTGVLEPKVRSQTGFEPVTSCARTGK